MKIKHILTLIFFAILVFLGVILFYFRPTNNVDDISHKSISDSSPSTIETSSVDFPQASNQNEVNSNLENSSQIVPPKMKNFVKKIESVLNSPQSRDSQIVSLMNILHSAESDDEKIATLQSLATLKPIEYVDELIIFSESNKESDKVRAEALNALNQAYLISDADVNKVGGSTIYVQMEKVKQYVSSLINDKNTPPALYKSALQGYAYMDPDQALVLATNMANRPNALSETESNFFNDAMFVDSNNLVRLLPVIQQNPDKITDYMASQIAITTADPTILNDLDDNKKKQIINILESHRLDKNNPMYQVELDTINSKVEQIESTLIH